MPKDNQEADGNLQAAADKQWARTIGAITKALTMDNPSFSEDYFTSTISGLTKGTNCARNA